ncbi:MAG: NAD-glutamate dehydrogenase domain-containing protein, partial [Nitrospinota bacterium]
TRRGISHTKLKIIRTYRNLLIQYSGNLKLSSINLALVQHGSITEKILDFFDEKFSPLKSFGSQEKRIESWNKTKNSLYTMLLDVAGIQDDRILRSIIKLVDATLRTNFYITRQRDSKNTISIKIDPNILDFGAGPKPFREIFVYDIDMEGIHLRGGKISRGGVRWSERTDDFRTEILGLMKTQMVKNTIIVPVGSKGGFIVKRTKRNAGQDLNTLGIASYRKFISALLDITDNYGQDDLEVNPPKCIIYDEFDPYLVVAADKGTAAFSDIANEISAHFGFWLKDAFASGGSNGYNHKEMGITARGAWECAKRHFGEKNIDIQTSPITVVGIGDMSGDVFGNGMLLSKKIKLVAAFNHMHIFIDPCPGDTEKAHAERERLFHMKGSTWKDYPEELISPGGGVFYRNSKSIALTPEMRDLLKTTEDKVNGEDLVRLVLKAPVDMIFHGGIGTYVKASSEANSEVNEKGNDSVRVNGSDVRAKVIIEGGNLGITQKGRIEYEKCGGVINTDAIDNSAGVDTSDHEVNLKILIESLRLKGKIASDEEGSALLSQAREFVVERVLGHSNHQSAIISMDRLKLLKDPTNFFDILKTLESKALLNRDEDHIPGNGEIEQMIHSTGFPRSILSYIMGLEKIRLYNIISHSEITKIEIFQKFLFEYFPPELHKKYGAEILNHRLSKNIIANFLTNRVINRGGLSFVHSLSYHSPASVEQVIETYFFVDEILEAQKFRAHAMELENSIKTEVLYGMLIRYERVIYKMVRWILQQRQEKFVDFEKIAVYKEKIQNYYNEYFLFLSEISPERYKRLFDEIEELKGENVPEELAKEAEYSIFLKPALGLIRISEQTGLSIRMVAESNIIIGERFHFNYLHSCLRALSLKTEWDKACHNALKSELYAKLDQLVSKILLIPTNGIKTDKEEESPLSRIYKFLGIKTGYEETEATQKCEEMRRSIIEKLEKFIDENNSQIVELDKLVQKLKESAQSSLTPVVVIEKFIANLVG